MSKEYKLLKNVSIIFVALLSMCLFSCGTNNLNNETKDFNTTLSNKDKDFKSNDDSETQAETKEVIIIQPTEIEKESLDEKAKDFPIFDGSTANLPLMAQVLSDYFDISREYAERDVLGDITRTDESWEYIVSTEDKKLIDKKILLVYEPSNYMKEQIKNSNNKLIINPIGVDALVFLKNKNNNVKNLTIENIQNIYSGKSTNWKDFGGEDIKIEAYQRVYNSGSQTLFLKKVMKDIKPTQVEKDYELADMGGVYSTLSTYDNTANAIGYSVFYYADKMMDYPNLDFFSVDGVYPSDETIANGTYPLLNEFYVVIREDAAYDSPARKMYEYILSDKGKDSLVKAGYIPCSNNGRINFE